MSDLNKPQGLRQAMAWLHTWSGLLVCWVLFLVYCSGTASYVKEEISTWMKPEWHARLAAPVAPVAAAEQAVAFLQRQAPDAERWFIQMPNDRRPTITAFWLRKAGPDDAGKGARARLETRHLDATTGAPVPGARETRGGEFLYRLHFDLHYMPAKWGRWIIGVCTMFMLVAIVSGVITHRRIFADFFTFRPRKGQRSWLDGHNVAAVLALPFHLMITYTGLVTLLFLYMPWGIQAVYRGDDKAFNAELAARAPQVKAAGVAAPLAPIGPMVRQAIDHWDGTRPLRISIDRPNDAQALVSVMRDNGRNLTSQPPTVVFDGATGALRAMLGDTVPPANATRGVMVGLHIASFAPPLLRALFFLSGLAGCLMVATGALLWAVKTRQQQARAIAQTGRTPFGLRLVEALNLGAIAGVPMAFAAYFWANRLLPADLAHRSDMEIRAFFIAWAAVALLGQWRPTRGMWRAMLGLVAVLFATLPVLDAVTTSAALTRLPAPVIGFDLVVLALGTGFGATAWWLGRKPRLRAPVVPRAMAGDLS
ncbi:MULTISPECIES: PepSY-associated TM helix domain-containing protein [unclassified Cupriavidus]|uniref:PepSY-associated TM helix domain-containing protein n=1 Tax=Cupriavidus sp. H19C3 TaxID=3241603 RepID=UPI0011DC4B69|nr:MAG: PepSY domain-containing protein [Cupriavidus sp.]